MAWSVSKYDIDTIKPAPALNHSDSPLVYPYGFIIPCAFSLTQLQNIEGNRTNIWDPIAINNSVFFITQLYKTYVARIGVIRNLYLNANANTPAYNRKSCY
ncbi:hypothetical protein DOY81_004408 [Sarcophaga bullata]|nr:hypothetical protein DOY81_004408 [Sarcophaga bullata]